MSPAPVQAGDPLPIRVAATARQVSDVTRCLGEAVPQIGLGVRAKAFFHNEGRRLVDELTDLRLGLAQGREDGFAGWARLGEVDRHLDVFLEESFGVLAAVHLLNTDSGALSAHASQDLLMELARDVGIPWDGAVLPCLRFVLSRRPGLIRLPFPLDAPWELPVVAHEFGHVVEDRLESPGGLREVRNAVAAHDSPAHLSELFADLYAAWTTGPAYGFAALVLHLAPTEAEGSESHPPAALRARWILGALRRRGEEVGHADWDAAVDTLEAAWSGAVRDAAPPPSFDEDDEGPGDSPGATPVTDDDFERLCGILEGSPTVAYDTWYRALHVRDSMDPGGAPPVPAPDLSCRDVLNGAWLARLRWPEAEGDIRRSALQRLAPTSEDGEPRV